MSDWRIERRHGREFLVRPPCFDEVCGAASDGYRCVLEKDHESDEHIATGFLDRSGAEIFKRWPVGRRPGASDE